MVEVSESIAAEALRTDCFLCRPNAALLVDVGLTGYAMAGLGPIASGYTVVATHGHVQGLSALSADDRRSYAYYAASVASRLSARYGGCFIVEHGNMAVCGIEQAEGRAHCFHPHFLLVPDQRCSIDAFHDYFGSEHSKFGSLEEAVQYGADRGQYLLAGHIAGPFHVFLPSGTDLPRQFARALLAEQLGADELASWRDRPDPAWAAKNADAVRSLLRRP